MKLFIAILILLSTTAFADTLQFCSLTTIAAAVSTVAGKSQATLASASAISPGPCTTPPPPTACPVIPSATAGIANFTRWAGYQNVFFCANGCGKSVDVTKFNAVYGVWPGLYGLIAYFQLPTKNYFSLAFTVPPNYMHAPNVPVPLYGAYKVGETGANASQSMTISSTCGAFSNPAVYPASTVIPGCWKNKSTSSSNLLQWRNSGLCTLESGKTYYLNVINADVTQVTPTAGSATSTKSAQCSTYACQVPVMDAPGSWSGYTPKP